MSSGGQIALNWDVWHENSQWIYSTFFLIILLIYLFRGFLQLHQVGPPSLAVHGLLTGGASRCRAQAGGRAAFRGWLPVTVAVVHQLSCSKACGIFPDQGSNPRSAGARLNPPVPCTVPPGKSSFFFFLPFGMWDLCSSIRDNPHPLPWKSVLITGLQQNSQTKQNTF